MTRPPDFTAIIVAAGKGERAGLAQPKQFAPLAGQPMVRWSVEAFARHPRCTEIIVVTQDAAAMQSALANLSVHITTGGATRQDSVANGLAAMRMNCPLVMVHDAARPGLSAAVIDRLLAAFDDGGVSGAIPALPVADTLARGEYSIDETVPRDNLWRVQTPQAFRTPALVSAHAQTAMDMATDDAQLVRAQGGRVALVPGDPALEKVTGPGDLERVALAIRGSASAAVRQSCTGMGFDVHRLVPGDGVWLGGLLIPHDRKLLGHSDADVVLHAITDALLGAIGAGDIGDHFPPSEPRWAGAASDQFLAHAARLSAQAGADISSVDVTIICEAPRIGPHRAAMTARIAEILGLDATLVSVKATTTEMLGFTGRGEGIAALAVVSVLR